MEFKTLEIKDIEFKENSRRANCDLSELMASIKSEGLKQPVLVFPNLKKTGKKYILAAGNRRIEATKKLGRKTIFALVDDKIKNESDFIIANLTENLQREDISVYEMGRYIYLLIEKCNLTIKETAARLGKSVKLVKRALDSYQRTPKDFRDKIVSDKKSSNGRAISLGLATKINNAKKDKVINQKQARELFKLAESSAYTNEHICGIINKMKNGSNLESSIHQEKQTQYIYPKIKVLSKEVNGKDVQKRIEQIIYGESKDFFTRP